MDWDSNVRDNCLFDSKSCKYLPSLSSYGPLPLLRIADARQWYVIKAYTMIAMAV